MIAAVLDRTAARYRACGRFARHYVAAKLRMDPVHADILALAATEPFGRVLDLGCGYGQMGVALLEAGLAESVVGLDRRAGALAEARRAAHGLPWSGARRDLASGAIADAADTVLMVDVLYQLDPAAQPFLLRQAAEAAGRLILIRTADPSRGFRSRAVRLSEQAFRRVWPNAGAHVAAPEVNRLIAQLASLGFGAVAAACSRGTPFRNVLVAGRRR